MGELFGKTIIGEPFQILTISHVVMLIVFVASLFMLFLFRNILQNRKHSLRYTLAGFLIFSEITLYVWYLYTGIWDPIDSLPLQLCSISILLSIVMLFTRSYIIFEITYFLGIGGAVQALLTPELGYDFPHYRYFHFFLAHIAIVLASVYMVWFERYRPTIKSLFKAFGVLNLIAIFVFFINKLIGANYMFLSEKPSNPSILDFLGPYPLYIISLEIVALIIFFLLLLPFVRKKS